MIKAFPSVISIHNGRQEHSGMDLRDWFAGQALPECIGWGEPEKVCAGAYMYADEMMKAREQHDRMEEKTSVSKD
jgi:hypothetical protein